MWKVMLVEDEWIVREGLKQTIDWKAAECEVVGEASNGAEALKQLPELQPDILLTDIRMPGMNGVEMAEQAVQLLDDAEIIFLTGFDDFAYVQQALRLGACDYVLKPTNPDELMNVLRRAAERLRRRREARLEQERLRQELVQVQPTALEQLARLMLLGLADEAQAAQWAERTAECPERALVVAATWDEDGTRRALFDWLNARAPGGDGQAAGSAAGPAAPLCLTVPLTEQSLAAVFFTEAEDALLEPLQTLQARRQLHDLRVGISRLHDHRAELRRAYREALLALEQAQASAVVRQYEEKASVRLNAEWTFADVLRDIHLRYGEPISLQEMADRLHMSESNFSKLFKKHAGVSFHEYVTGVRVTKAKEWLRRPDVKVYEVALRCGYQDQRYFSQIFRKWTGLTPSEYRQRLGIAIPDDDRG
jgi:two-component system response regulator YesN